MNAIKYLDLLIAIKEWQCYTAKKQKGLKSLDCKAMLYTSTLSTRDMIRIAGRLGDILVLDYSHVRLNSIASLSKF